MIYTSYFAKLRNIPNSITPIAICAKCPDFYTGLRTKILAPSYNTLMKYKEDKNEDDYRQKFYSEVLNKMDVDNTVEYLKNMAESEDIVLLCYEKSSDFCHRHLVADWLRNNGYQCEEFI